MCEICFATACTSRSSVGFAKKGLLLVFEGYYFVRIQELGTSRLEAKVPVSLAARPCKG